MEFQRKWKNLVEESLTCFFEKHDQNFLRNCTKQQVKTTPIPTRMQKKSFSRCPTWSRQLVPIFGGLPFSFWQNCAGTTLTMFDLVRDVNANPVKRDLCYPYGAHSGTWARPFLGLGSLTSNIRNFRKTWN